MIGNNENCVAPAKLTTEAAAAKLTTEAPDQVAHCLKRPLKKNTKIGFKYQLPLNAGQKYCRMLQGEHSAKLSTFIKLPFVLRPMFCLFLSGGLRQVLP